MGYFSTLVIILYLTVSNSFVTWFLWRKIEFFSLKNSWFKKCLLTKILYCMLEEDQNRKKLKNWPKPYQLKSKKLENENNAWKWNNTSRWYRILNGKRGKTCKYNPWGNCICNAAIFLNNNFHGMKYYFSFSDWPLHPQVHQNQLRLQGDLDHHHLQLAEDPLHLLVLPVPVIQVSKCSLNAFPVIKFRPSIDPFPLIRDPNPRLTLTVNMDCYNLSQYILTFWNL